jgi:hypothetical protein
VDVGECDPTGESFRSIATRAPGPSAREFFEDDAAAKERVEDLRRLRIRRGYHLHSRTEARDE